MPLGQTGKGAGDKLGRGGLAKKPPTGGRGPGEGEPLREGDFLHEGWRPDLRSWLLQGMNPDGHLRPYGCGGLAVWNL